MIARTKPTLLNVERHDPSLERAVREDREPLLPWLFYAGLLLVISAATLLLSARFEVPDLASRLCDDAIKAQLDNPDSYRRNSSQRDATWAGTGMVFVFHFTTKDASGQGETRKAVCTLQNGQLVQGVILGR